MKTSCYLILALAVAVMALAVTGCAEYPLTLSVKGDYGRASYSAKSGIEITIEK